VIYAYLFGRLASSPARVVFNFISYFLLPLFFFTTTLFFSVVTTMATQVCPHCKLIRFNELKSTKPMFIDPFGLEKSATVDRQCVLCSILFRSLHLFLVNHSLPATRNTPSIFPDESTIVVYHPFSISGTVILKLRWIVIIDAVARTVAGPPQGFDVEIFTLSGMPSLRSSILTKAYRFNVIIEQPSPWEAFGPAQILSSSTSLAVCLEKLQVWVRNCEQEHHTECLQLPTTPLPTRVIDVGSTTCSPFLLESVGISAPYIALSHCWGKGQPLTTTRSTLYSRKQKIEWDAFPATFQDAITLTRSLGIQYLWIDSLCIIQGDREDWEKEASRMASVYGNSYLTIAATMAPNATFGLFRTSLPDPPTFEFRETDVSGVSFTVYAREKIQHMTPAEDHPLLVRAWTFQEHLLSPRIIQFGKHEIVWECNMRRWCCCTSPDDPITERRTTKIGFSRFLRNGFSGTFIENWEMPDDRKSLIDARHRWNELIVDYTKRSLTKAEDRLTALAGVARVFSSIMKCQYLAGLWEADLIAGLLWYCPDSGISRILGEYRAPSYSWASVETSISFHNHLLPRDHDDFDVQVIENQSTVRTIDPFGSVSDGYIKMKGRLVEGRFSYRSDSLLEDFFDRGGISQPFNRDVKRLSPVIDLLHENDILNCLLISGTEKDWYALVLRSCRKEIAGCPVFQRVGMVSQGYGDTKSWFHEVEPTAFYLI
jgi:hypothetical protein